MPKLLDNIKKLLIYEDKPEFDEFELLETYDEHKNNQNEQEDGKLKNENEEKNKQTKKPDRMIDSDLNKNIQTIKQEFNMPKNHDIIIKEFNIARKVRAAIVFINGMVDRTTINNFVLRQLMAVDRFSDDKDNYTVEYIKDNVLSIHNTEKFKEFDKIIKQILNGMTALFIEECDDCLVIETSGYEKRNVDKPVTETVVRGAQEGFNENMRTSITLVRRIIRNKNLITEILPMGNKNNGNCSILYLEGVANPKVIQEVKMRIESIDIDFVSGDAMLEQLIEDEPNMIVPQVLSTERPDRTATFIMRGQVAIIADGTPFALIVPMVFSNMFHTSEDTNIKWQWGTFVRIIRVLALFMATLLPGLYVSFMLYHHQMIPTDLLASITKSREFVPFPTIIEVLIMEASFELVREAGERVPGVIGPTIGIIGALILGQAAVIADIISPILIIIVAITGLGNFAIPNYTLAASIRILRFAFIFSGAIAGFYGLTAVIVIISGLVCSMKSFGVPFLSPIAPKVKSTMDFIIRKPLWRHTQMPDEMNTIDKKKAGKYPNWWVKKKGGK